MNDVSTWKSINAAVLALLNDFDPYGLAPGDADSVPTDEYSPEAESIARHLIDVGRISASDVDAIWIHWFGESLSGIDKTRFDALVDDLNALAASRI